DGVATPFGLPFTANGFAGSFVVQAQAAIGNGPIALFHLTNLAPVTPAVQLTAPPLVLATQSATYNLSATLPANVTQPTYRIDWGDGPSGPDIQLLPVPSGSGGALSVQHTFSKAIQYPVSVAIVDGSGATVVSPVTVLINVAPVTAAFLQSLLSSISPKSVEFDVSTNADALIDVASINAQVVSSNVTFHLELIPAPGETFTDLQLRTDPLYSVDISGTTSTLVVGNSPALEVDSGNVTIDGLNLTTATNAPVILVTGGSLTVPNSTSTATGSSPAAIRVTGGTVDLGTAADPGTNVLDIEGAGNLIEDTSGNDISAVGDTFEVGGAPLPSNFLIADR